MRQQGRGELGMDRVVLGFFSKWTVQIDQQREQTARDKVNSIHIKPAIATLIQRYNTAIVSTWTAIRFSWNRNRTW